MTEAWKIVLCTVCGCLGIGLAAREINRNAEIRARSKREILADQEREMTAREREKTLQAKYRADQARYAAEEASTKAACDDCAHFASRADLEMAARTEFMGSQDAAQGLDDVEVV